jgi:hypothetical protein
MMFSSIFTAVVDVKLVVTDGCLKLGIKMRIIYIFLYINFLFAASFEKSFAQDSQQEGGANHPFSWGFESDFNSKYLWRGLNYNDGLVIQPNLWASVGNLSVGLWSNITAFDRFHSIRRNEIDLICTYTYNLGKFEIEHTLMLYYYPKQDDSPPTGELFTGVTYPVGDFSLFSNVAADFITYRGSLYFEHGVQYGKTIGGKLALTVTGLFAWADGKFNETYVGTLHTSVNLASVSIELNYSPWKTVYFRPHFQLNRTLNREMFPYMDKFAWNFGLLMGIEI